MKSKQLCGYQKLKRIKILEEQRKADFGALHKFFVTQPVDDAHVEENIDILIKNDKYYCLRPTGVVTRYSPSALGPIPALSGRAIQLPPVLPAEKKTKEKRCKAVASLSRLHVPMRLSLSSPSYRPHRSSVMEGGLRA
ncbi:hypothetical protein LXL04_035824 [Taraxacum kok-saghyz]